MRLVLNQYRVCQLFRLLFALANGKEKERHYSAANADNYGYGFTAHGTLVNPIVVKGII